MPVKRVIIRETFHFLSAVAMAFIVMETIWPNIILAYFNLNYLFLLWLVFLSALLIKK